jgi:hypothetical protein
MAGFTKLPTLEALRTFKEDREINGLIFPLNATSIGMENVMEVRVRRISSVDTAAIQMLPQEIQDTVWEGIDELKAAQKGLEGAGEPDNLSEMLANNTKIVNAARIWSRAAFIYPRLAENDTERIKLEREITDETPVWTVDDIEAEDLVSILMMCLDADGAAAKKLKSFRPEWTPGLPDGAPGAVAEPALESVGSASTGLHAVPVS